MLPVEQITAILTNVARGQRFRFPDRDVEDLVQHVWMMLLKEDKMIHTHEPRFINRFAQLRLKELYRMVNRTRIKNAVPSITAVADDDLIFMHVTTKNFEDEVDLEMDIETYRYKRGKHLRMIGDILHYCRMHDDGKRFVGDSEDHHSMKFGMCYYDIRKTKEHYGDLLEKILT